MSYQVTFDVPTVKVKMTLNGQNCNSYRGIN